MSSTVYQAQREAYRHKLMFELMFREEEQVDLKRYIRAFVSLDLLCCLDSSSGLCLS